MWKGKPNCVCSELEWLQCYGGHVERLKNVRAFMKFTSAPIAANYTTHNAKREVTRKRKLTFVNNRQGGRDTRPKHASVEEDSTNRQHRGQASFRRTCEERFAELAPTA